MKTQLALVLMFTTALVGCNSDAEYPVVGTLERDRIVLTAELREPVIAIDVREGQQVAAGEQLVALDPARAEADLDQLRARRDRRARRLDELLRGPRQEAIDEARARLEAAESTHRGTVQEYQRIQHLRERGLSSEAELDAATTARDRAAGERDAARAALAALLDGTTVEELGQARAALAEAEAALTRQQLTLARLQVRAPRAAGVESLPFELGETPAPGEPLVVLRAEDRPPYARVYIPAALRASFAPGARVRVKVDYHGEFTGTVRFIDGEAAFTPYFALTEHDAGRLSYLAEIDLEDARDLPSGVPVRAVAMEDEDE